MKILVTRHGQTGWNLEKRIQGWSDNPLNEFGINQANILRDKLKNVNIDICYSSPLFRAAKTAQIVLGYNNDDARKCPIWYDKRIRERGFGTLEGKLTSEVEDFIFHESWDLDLNSGKYGIEPIKDLYKRVHEFYYSKILPLKEKDDNTTVFIVTHGGASRVLNYVILGGGIVPDKNSEAYKATQNFILKNCDLVEYNI